MFKPKQKKIKTTFSDNTKIISTFGTLSISVASAPALAQETAPSTLIENNHVDSKPRSDSAKEKDNELPPTKSFRGNR